MAKKASDPTTEQALADAESTIEELEDLVKEKTAVPVPVAAPAPVAPAPAPSPVAPADPVALPTDQFSSLPPGVAERLRAACSHRGCL